MAREIIATDNGQGMVTEPISTTHCLLFRHVPPFLPLGLAVFLSSSLIV